MRLRRSLKAIPLLAILFSALLPLPAQTADQAWLNYQKMNGWTLFPRNIRTLGSGAIEQSAMRELNRGLGNLAGESAAGLSARALESVSGETILGTAEEFRKLRPDVRIPSDLAPGAFWFSRKDSNGKHRLLIVGGDERGVLYGTFNLLRPRDDKGFPLEVRESPAMPIRWVDEWDNIDGSIERGYAGRSIFFDAGHVRPDLTPATEYARLLASIGINGCNLNNVNNASAFFTPAMFKQVARIADAMRPYGVRVSLSADIASPQKIGGLSTFDPLDPTVQKWWSDKVSEIYRLIPDFGGFTVKADSEGQPGPASYGRSPADAANVLAALLAPHNGVVLYRAFVYNHHLDWNDPKADRARAAYDIFHPLDGKFAPNVIIQTKEGPIDFQVREPVSPLFGGIPHTNQAMELQITQEYLGQQRHLVYIAPMWKEVLDFDMRVNGASTPVKQIISGQSFHRPLGGIVGVACVGQNNWLGSPLALANLYAFGRLAWNPDLNPEDIAAEWTRQTISSDAAVVHTVVNMLMKSWPAYENYTGPLGLQTLTDITGSHYGPNVEASERNGWGQWHKADHNGVGFDRTAATGTGFVGQYPPEVAKIYESEATTPDNLLLFFHHVPYTYKLDQPGFGGKTVIQYLYDSHNDGAAQAAQFVTDWQSIQSKLDPALFADVLPRLEYQAGHAIVWRDAVTQYFLKLSGIPDAQGRAGRYPNRLEAEDASLTGYTVIDVNPWEDASHGKAVSCGESARKPAPGGDPAPNSALKGHDLSRAGTAPKESGASAPAATHCSATFTYTGQPGAFNLAVQYFDLPGGSAQFTLSINDRQTDTWSASDHLPSQRPNGDNSTRRIVRNLTLKPGDTIRVNATPDNSDPAALDYIELLPQPAN
ncbi:alpha-glucuronidase family glycosyl hydrolase [Occallatibacter savannae]|uniref:alpha-glucuronidase family glycosyl hydrolase n=1 Tax=Occallatibacter savannae TaxID=1002691 RepID=UPI0013A5B256|nr:alpha-glucuronidase family glycosyl hydrolase [Occallatibacter savannae]